MIEVETGLIRRSEIDSTEDNTEAVLCRLQSDLNGVRIQLYTTLDAIAADASDQINQARGKLADLLG